MADVNALVEAWPTLDDDTKGAILKLAGIDCEAKIESPTCLLSTEPT